MKKGQHYTIDDYEITRDGQIINKHNNHILKPQGNGKGYLKVVINGKTQYIHRLVATKYIPNPENKEQVNHINGDKTDNRVENLEWVTNQENRNHATKNDLIAYGENISSAILTENQVREIKRSSLTNNELADKYGVSPHTIRDIKNNKTWIRVK